MNKRPVSLKWGLIVIIVLCWLIPIGLVITMAGVLLTTNYDRYIKQEMDTGIQNAMDQVERNLEDLFFASKAVSYDGVVRGAYREFQDAGGNGAALYARVEEYLTQNFSRNDQIEAVFIPFVEGTLDGIPYFIRQDISTYETLQVYQNAVQPEVMEFMETSSAEIHIFHKEDRLYIVRNLLDSRFEAYAAVVFQCEPELVMQPFSTLTQLSDVTIVLDGVMMRENNGTLVMLNAEEFVFEEADELYQEADVLHQEVSIDQHMLSFSARVSSLDLWSNTPNLQTGLALVCLLVFPLMMFAVSMFYHHVSNPMEKIVEAASRVRNGERGYIIDEIPGNIEFRQLYSHFNSMSMELKNQFNRLYLEQQALQQAKIKALQSQINPHFLNNTLEIINWEARLAGDEQVSAMIEALSTMLDAALDRDGRASIPLREELVYVDAYLYIITRRLGDGLKVEKQLDEEVMDRLIPRLVLQPIVENAVEHDITERRGGTICIRAYEENGAMVLEVEHDGTMSEEDRKKVHDLLTVQTSEPVRGGRVGLRNVNQRLKLLYGPEGGLSLEERTPGKVVARLVFPLGDA